MTCWARCITGINQFYGNGLVALAFAFLVRRGALGLMSAPLGWMDASFVALAGILAAGSRDTFRKYHQRVEMVLGSCDAALDGEQIAPAGISDSGMASSHAAEAHPPSGGSDSA